MKLRLFVKFLHLWSRSRGGESLPFFCLPNNVISLLKSPVKICMWFGWFCIRLAILVWMFRIKARSSRCDGIYKCTSSHGWSWLLVIFIACMYGEMAAGVEIFWMLLGNAYFLFISIKRPSRILNVFRCYAHLVMLCILLKISLYSRIVFQCILWILWLLFFAFWMHTVPSGFVVVN